MVRIRLRRQGAKKQPTYRVVVADSRSPRDGRFIENIGIYDPKTDPPTMRVDADRALHWLKVGAQPSDAVLRILKAEGVWQQFKGTEVEPGAEAEPSELDAAAESATPETDDLPLEDDRTAVSEEPVQVEEDEET